MTNYHIMESNLVARIEDDRYIGNNTYYFLMRMPKSPPFGDSFSVSSLDDLEKEADYLRESMFINACKYSGVSELFKEVLEHAAFLCTLRREKIPIAVSDVDKLILKLIRKSKS